MKSYLPLERASVISGCAAPDLKLLCEAGRLDCRQTNEECFVAEDEVVETLSMMNRSVLLEELEDLRQGKKVRTHVDSTIQTSQKLLRSAAIVFVMLFGLMAVMAWSARIAEDGGVAVIEELNASFATLLEDGPAAIFWSNISR